MEKSQRLVRTQEQEDRDLAIIKHQTKKQYDALSEEYPDVGISFDDIYSEIAACYVRCLDKYDNRKYQDQLFEQYFQQAIKYAMADFKKKIFGNQEKFNRHHLPFEQTNDYKEVQGASEREYESPTAFRPKLPERFVSGLFALRLCLNKADAGAQDLTEAETIIDILALLDIKNGFGQMIMESMTHGEKVKECIDGNMITRTPKPEKEILLAWLKEGKKGALEYIHKNYPRQRGRGNGVTKSRAYEIFDEIFENIKRKLDWLLTHYDFAHLRKSEIRRSLNIQLKHPEIRVRLDRQFNGEKVDLEKLSKKLVEKFSKEFQRLYHPDSTKGFDYTKEIK